MEAEEAALKRRKELIASALNTAKDAATEAKNAVVPLLKFKNRNNNGANEHESVRGYTPPSLPANNSKDPETPGSTPKAGLFNGLSVQGGGRTRKPRRR
jgi:hypothetical protein